MGQLGDDGVCASCGMTPDSYVPSPHHLPPGTMLNGRYMIGRVLGEGGFGITYIAYDVNLEIKVAIKEYYPVDRATRNNTVSTDVTSFIGPSRISYEKGKERFIDEARALGKMEKQPSIVDIRDFFEKNNTAYIVMEYVDGETFKSLVEKNGGRMDPKNLFDVIKPLFSAIGYMHKKGLIHRDISPDNLMLENEQVKLLDFGCVKEMTQEDGTQTVSLKHGYAPPEQYTKTKPAPTMDVYALCATIYYCLTGKTPPYATERTLGDTIVLPRDLGVKIPKQCEKALMHGLELYAANRIQSMEELEKALYAVPIKGGSGSGGGSSDDSGGNPDVPKTTEEPGTKGPTSEKHPPVTNEIKAEPESKGASKKFLPIIIICVVVVILAAVLSVFVVMSKKDGGDMTDSADGSGSDSDSSAEFYPYNGDVLPSSVKDDGLGAPGPGVVYFAVDEKNVIHDGKGVWQNDPNMYPSAVFDLNKETFYDCDELSENANSKTEMIGIPGDGKCETGYVGVRFDDYINIAYIRYCPRDEFPNRMVGGRFEVSRDGLIWQTVYTISKVPAAGKFTTISLYSNANTDGLNDSFASKNDRWVRYVRYVSPREGYCNVAEIEIWVTELSKDVADNSNNSTENKGSSKTNSNSDLYGSVGLGAWTTENSFDNLTVKAKDGTVLYENDFSDPKSIDDFVPKVNVNGGWDTKNAKSEWTIHDGILQNSSSDSQGAVMVLEKFIGDKKTWTGYTVEFDFRINGGVEGCLVYVAYQDDDNYIMYNIGGWSNEFNAFEPTQHGRKTTLNQVEAHYKTNQWYHVKISLVGENAFAYVDGKLLNELK